MGSTNLVKNHTRNRQLRNGRRETAFVRPTPDEICRAAAALYRNKLRTGWAAPPTPVCDPHPTLSERDVVRAWREFYARLYGEVAFRTVIPAVASAAPDPAHDPYVMAPLAGVTIRGTAMPMDDLYEKVGYAFEMMVADDLPLIAYLATQMGSRPMVSYGEIDLMVVEGRKRIGAATLRYTAAIAVTAQQSGVDVREVIYHVDQDHIDFGGGFDWQNDDPLIDHVDDVRDAAVEQEDADPALVQAKERLDEVERRFVGDRSSVAELIEACVAYERELDRVVGPLSSEEHDAYHRYALRHATIHHVGELSQLRTRLVVRRRLDEVRWFIQPLARVNATTVDVQRDWDQARGDAEVTLTAIKPAIDAVARALQERGRLGSDDIRQLFYEAMSQAEPSAA